MPDSVGVVVVNYNGQRFLVDCLRRLVSGLRGGDEVIVVDNASADGSIDELVGKFPDVSVLRQPANLGVAAGNNIGIRHALGRGHGFVLLMNYDTRPAPGLVPSLLAAACPGTMITASTSVWDTADVSNSHAGGFNWWLGRLTEVFHGRRLADLPQTPQPVAVADTCCLLVPRDVFDRVGLMDEAYFLYYDDTDFVVRAADAGVRCLFQPSARLEHFERGASGPTDESPLSVYFSSRNRLYFMRKHRRSRVQHLVFLAYFTVTRLAHTARWARRRQWWLIRAGGRGIADFVHGRMGPAPSLQGRAAR